MLRKLILCIIVCVFQLQVINANAQVYPAGACRLVPGSQACSDTTPCKALSNGITACLAGVSLPSGAVSLKQSCWKYTYTYACADSGTSIDSCTTASWYNPQTCSISARNCTNTDSTTGNCTSYNMKYSCVSTPSTNTQQTVCSNNVLNQAAFPTPENKNNSFAVTAAAMEVAREVQVYASCDSGDAFSCASKPLFSGVNETCRKGYFGLQNCCNSAPGGTSNSQVMNTALGTGSKVIMYAGKQAVDAASPYVFDAMYSAGGYAAGLANSMTSINSVTSGTFGGYTTATGTSFASSGISAYGFTFASSVAEVGGGFMGGNMLLAGTAGTNTAIMFNPYAFAAAVALQFAISAIQKAMACTQQEQMLAMHKGSNLSVFTGETCTNKIPIIGTCLEYTSTYCSFNSIFAKIVNKQGKAQLGLNFNNCSGLTVSQIASLDFSKMDLSELTTQVLQQAQAGVPSSPEIQTNYQPIMQNSSGGSAQSSTNGTGLK